MEIKKLKIALPYDPVISRPFIYPIELKSVFGRDTCSPTFTAALFTIVKTWRQWECPSASEWIKNCIYIQPNIIQQFVSAAFIIFFLTLSDLFGLACLDLSSASKYFLFIKSLLVFPSICVMYFQRNHEDFTALTSGLVFITSSLIAIHICSSSLFSKKFPDMTLQIHLFASPIIICIIFTDILNYGVVTPIFS